MHIKLENATVERVDNIHFLGIHIDETLDWNSHIDKKSPDTLEFWRNLNIIYLCLYLKLYTMA